MGTRHAIGDSVLIIKALTDKKTTASDLVNEHIDWAIAQQMEKNAKVSRKTLRLLNSVERGMPQHS